ncbi:MAG: hypothetical protein ACI90V_005399, partial [Bacillariaceae sp.]|jgi:hypothetical protein
VNVGDGGTTCRQWVKRIGNNVDKHSPSTVVLVCGENDLFNRYADEVFEDFRKVVDTIYAKGVERVIYMGTKPEPDTKDLHIDYREYDEMIRNYYVDDEPDGKFTMVDVYSSFVALGNPRSLYANDNLHLSKEGYNFWNDWLQSALADADCVRWQDGDCAVRTDGGGNEDDNNSPDESTPTPTSCSDDPNFRFRGKKRKDCDWVGRKPNRRCGKKYKGSKLWKYCPLSCGDC